MATAFNAPIGGLLFAFEEVASFWQHSLGWQVRQYAPHEGHAFFSSVLNLVGTEDI